VVGAGPDVILANGNPVILALAKLTTTIPIVFAQIVDPVGLGVVQSLARPGGNVTGFTFVDLELLGKWPQILSEVAPHLEHAALIFDPATTPFYADYLRTLEQGRMSGSIPYRAAPVRRADDLESVIAAVAAQPKTGLVVPPNPLLGAYRRHVAELTTRFRVPSISVYRQYAPEGGLISYGPNQLDLFLRATAYVDRILRGARPGDLPVQAPTAFEMVVNAKTARDLDLVLPASIVARADEVIE
jgi:putative ABC transport system substrate-binding protein